jgi:hypothetical protein
MDRTISQLFESVLPYMAVGGYSLMVDDGLVYDAGPGKAVYNLNVKTMSLARVEDRPSNNAMTYKVAIETLFSENRFFTFNGVNLPMSSAFVFTYTKIFDLSDVNWIESGQLGLSSNDKRKINELMNPANDPPLSTLTNLIHLFIFINRMPLFFRCMQATDKQGVSGILTNEFSDEVLAGLSELRTLGYKTHSSTYRNTKVSDMIETLSPIICSTNRSTPPSFVSLECPSSPLVAKNKLIDAVDEYRKLVRTLNGKQTNLGFVFLLNYWMYRSTRMKIINDRFPLNLDQQSQSLKSMTSGNLEYNDVNGTLISSLLFSSEPIIFMETRGVFEGNRYPNCVEQSVFKLIQLMLYNPSTKKLDISNWTSIDEELKELIANMNLGKQVDWNRLVCGRRRISYNEDDGYNIQSNVNNVLELLNQLSGNTRYKTLQEWVSVVYKNPKSLNLDVTTNTIRLGNYIFEIRSGHSSFDSMSTTMSKIFIMDDLLPIYSIFKLEKKNFVFLLTDNSRFETFKQAVPTRYLFDDELIISLKSRKPFPKNIVFGIFRERGIQPQDIYKEFIRLRIPLYAGLIPEGVTDIVFKDYFNQPIVAGVLPSSLLSLTFGHDFNQPIEPDVLPSSLQSLTFGRFFNRPIEPDVLPSSLQSLVFGDVFNQPIEPDVLPSSLQSLTFGQQFNKPIGVGVLPPSLQSLTISIGFNHPNVVLVLPPSLQSLTIVSGFNQPIESLVLPSSLQSLVFNYNFNQPIGAGVLPSSLQSLRFGDQFNQPIGVGVLPSSLQSLEFGDRFNQPIGAGILPSSLQSLTLGLDFNQPVGAGVLPSSLQSLTFGDRFTQAISAGVLPSSLQSLTFGIYFNQPISAGVLPSSLQSLTFGYYFNQPISAGVLPSSLQSLTFGGGFDIVIGVGVLPLSLQSLEFGDEYDQPIGVGVLPSSLQSLTFGEIFNQSINTGVLPSTLKFLKFGDEYSHSFDRGVLPPSLQSLMIGDKQIIPTL